MQPKTIQFLKIFIGAGSIYALLMAGFNYSKGEGFNIYKFLIHFFFFGLIMAFILRNKLGEK